MNGDQVLGLVNVVDALVQLHDDLRKRTALGFVLMSDGDFCSSGGEGMSLISCRGNVNDSCGYLGVDFYFHVDALSVHGLSHSENFPCSLYNSIVGEICDLYLGDNAGSAEQEKFAQHVYESLRALVEQKIFESKFAK